MDSIAWRIHDPISIVFMFVFTFVTCIILYDAHYIPLLFITSYQRMITGKRSMRGERLNECPTALAIIPSLLRNDDDYEAIVRTVESCANDGYPNELCIIISIDGRAENPSLYNRLVDWCKAYTTPNGVGLHIICNEVRLSKMMAIDRGSHYMQEMIAVGAYTKFPAVYFSIDADSVLRRGTLERLASRLNSRHKITGNRLKVVAGMPCAHPSEAWGGWKKLFTLQGMIHTNTARLFLVANLARSNVGIFPYIGVPGAIYATWSELLVDAPKFMGYMKTITFLDWIRWWCGIPLPNFANSNAKPIPQLLTGNTDDTSMAVLINMASWKNGRLSLEPPQSPLHAIGRLFHTWFVERSHHYDSEAKVYTFMPPTIKGLWLQRLRWNSSRIELNMRCSKAFLFYFETGFLFMLNLLMVNIMFIRVVIAYGILPWFMLGQSASIPSCMFIGYSINMIMNTIFTLLALHFDIEPRKYWRTVFCLPTAGLFSLVFGATVGIWGIMKDVFGYGNNVRFTPAVTLIAGGSQRIAIMYRLRRFISMCIRSITYGDVPFGLWWGGWDAYEPYAKSGYNDWSSKKNSQYVLK